jgi:hypothetical protein
MAAEPRGASHDPHWFDRRLIGCDTEASLKPAGVLGVRAPSTNTLGGASAASADTGVEGDYTYQIHVRPDSWLWRRWRGRMVTIDAAGTCRYGRWLVARTRGQVVEALWNEAMFDIKYHARHASAIVIDDSALESETTRHP